MIPTRFSAAQATAAISPGLEREVDEIPGDVLGPIDDAPQRTAVRAAGGDCLTGGRDGGFVAVDDRFEVLDAQPSSPPCEAACRR